MNRAGDVDDTTVDTGGDVTAVDTELKATSGHSIVAGGRFSVFGKRGCRGFFGIGGITFATELPSSGFRFGFGRGLGVGFLYISWFDGLET